MESDLTGPVTRDDTVENDIFETMAYIFGEEPLLTPLSNGLKQNLRVNNIDLPVRRDVLMGKINRLRWGMDDEPESTKPR